MASRGLDYDYGTGGSGAGGKIRRRPASRSVAASPYARPAPAPALATATASASQGRGWFSRLISAGASRLLPSLFRKPPPQLAAPPPPLEPIGVTTLRPEASQEPLLLRQDVGPAFVPTQPELSNAPPSPPPPPLEDDFPEGEENGGAVANILGTENSSKVRDGNMLRNSDEHSLLNLEYLLKQKTFKRSEFEYLSELLWSRTVGSNSLNTNDGNLKGMHVSEKETGSMPSNLPADFSIATYCVSDIVASPAEIAKAYIGSKSANGSSLRLRLHDPSSLTIKSMETNMIQQARPPTIPLQGSRLLTSRNSNRFKSNFTTPNRSAIYKMSSSPYFKSAASSDDLFSSVPSSHQTPSSVHTFGRQVLKRKSTAVTVSVGPIRKMRQRYNRTSPLLETRPRYHGHSACHGSILYEDSEQTKKRRCLSKVSDGTLGGLDDKADATSFGQAPVQSAEMAAKILKQLDTLVPSQKEGTLERKQKHGNAIEVETCVSHKKEASEQSNLSEPSTSGVKDYSLLNGTKDNVTFTPAAVIEKCVDATLKTSASLMSESISPISSPKDKAPMFSSRNHPCNLVLSSEVDRSKITITSNGFTFPIPAVLGAYSQAPPTSTMTSPPMLPIGKLQPSAPPSADVPSVESGPRIPKSVLEEGSIAQKCDKMNADDQLMSSKSSGQVTSFTCNPVFKVANSKLPTLSNGLQHASNSVISDIHPAGGLISRASSSSAGSDTASTNSASVSAHHISTGGTISSSGAGSLSAVAGATVQSFLTPSLASSGAGSDGVPFSFSSQFGTASSSVTQDKSKTVSSSTPFSFSQQFGTVSSFSTQDISKSASTEPTIFSGNQHTQPGNNNTVFTHKPSEKPSGLNSQSVASSAVVSASLGSSFSASSLFSLAAGSSSTLVTVVVPPFSPMSSSATGSGSAFSASSVFGSRLTTTGLPNFGSASSPLSLTPSAVFSFTSATPSIPNSSPTTSIFTSATGSTTGIDQMNGGNRSMDRKDSPFSTTLPFGIPSNSPSTPIFSSPATQFASTTSASPEVFKFGEQNASSGGFSLGTGGGNEKPGRKFIRVKRRK